MRVLRSAASLAGLLLSNTLVLSCVDGAATKPSPASDGLIARAPRMLAATLPDVRVAEFHYDNVSTDVGEAIEISAPVSVDLTGWHVVLYNGNGGSVYDTDVITAEMANGATVCPGEERQIVVMTYPSNGIQNGAPDGIAVVSPGGVVSEFISYEGSFAATNGPANGTTATDIGVFEAGNELIQGSGVTAVVQSLKRNGAGSWTVPRQPTESPGFEPHSFGVCNDHLEPPPPPPVERIEVTPASATIVIGGAQTFVAKAFDALDNEIGGVAFDWSSSADAIATVTDAGVAMGVAAGSAEIRASAGGKTGTSALEVEDPLADPPIGSVFISEFHYDNAGADTDERIEVQGPAGTSFSGWKIVLYNLTNGAPYATLDLSDSNLNCGERVLTTVAAPGLQNGPADGMALVSPKGTLFEFLSYEGVLTGSAGVAGGRTSMDVLRAESGSEAPGRSIQRDALGWYGPAPSSFGGCNVVPPPFVSMFGRDATDPPLPVGFEFQLFAEYNNGRGDELPTTFTWMSDNVGLLSVDQDGIVRANGIGTGVIRSIAADGTVGTFTVPTQAATPSATARYGNHVEFGVPTDGNAADDHVIQFEQYTASYNKNRNTANWVSFNLEESHIGANRCDCFTFDQSLPADFTRYSTAHYVGSLDFYGFQYDRGHLLRSNDRAGVLDNARTFYLTNIIPQTADNNQGPWSRLEIRLADLARLENKELYVIAGVAGDLGTLMDKNLITIPASVWKVAVILPRDHGIANVRSYREVQIIAVNMPNLPGILGDPWEKYETTVDEVERISGYDVLALLDDRIEAVVEAGMQDEIGLVDKLVANGKLNAGNGNALIVKLEAAAAALHLGDVNAAVAELEAFLSQVRALSRSRRLDDPDVETLTSAIRKLISSLAS